MKVRDREPRFGIGFFPWSRPTYECGRWVASRETGDPRGWAHVASRAASPDQIKTPWKASRADQGLLPDSLRFLKLFVSADQMIKFGDVFTSKLASIQPERTSLSQNELFSVAGLRWEEVGARQELRRCDASLHCHASSVITVLYH